MDTTRGTIATPPKLLWRETLTRLRSYKCLQRKGKIEPFNSKRYSLSTTAHMTGEPIQLIKNSISPRLLSPLQPCHQEDTLVDTTTTISDVTNAIYEKDKELMVLPFPTDVMAQSIPESSAGWAKKQQENKRQHQHQKHQHQRQQQQQHYHYQIRNESLMNKSFRKIIHFSRMTTWLVPKAIATATSSVSLPDHHPLPSHKYLPLEYYSNTSDLTSLRLPSFDEFSNGSEMDQLSSFREEINATSTQNTLSNKTRTSSRKNLRFNIHQITSLTSARDLEYELLVKINQQTVAVRYGQMKKLAKGISSCSLPEDWLSLKVHEPFELTILINTKPTRPYKMADYLARRRLWPLWSRKRNQMKIQQQQQQQQQQQSDTASSGHSPCWSSSSEETSSADVLPSLTSGITSASAPALASASASPSSSSTVAATTTSPTSFSSGMELTGYWDIPSGDDMELMGDGHHRYRLTKPQLLKSSNSNPSLNIEVLIEFLWQAAHPSDKKITTSSTSKPALSSHAYPWLRYPNGAISPTSPDIENEEILLADKDAVHAAITHTTHGDHLTFYLHNVVSPKWERYWVMIKNERLLIFSTIIKNKAPIYDVPLRLLAQVSKPTEEDQEYACLNRQVGIVVQLKVDSNHESINTPLGNRIYILADTPRLALHWTRALTVIKGNNQVQALSIV